MSESLPPKQRCSLRRYVDGYLHDLDAQGYTESTQDHYRGDLLHFIKHAEQKGIYSARRFAVSVEKLLPSVSDSKWSRRGIRATVNRFIEYLVRHGMVSFAKVAPQKTPYGQHLHGFIRFQVEHRGVCTEYAKGIRRFCTGFLEYLRNHGLRHLSELTPETLLDFLTEEGRKYRRKTLRAHCSILRSFLSYLHRHGVIHRNLTGVILGPRIFKDESCPKYIIPSQIQAVLSHIDCSTRTGVRDYAMILLLVTYGLRGSEVVRLRLDDIDWRHNRIHINNRKARNDSVYPLASSVAKALIRYLKEVRPPRSDRHVFLSVKTPYHALAFTWGLGDRVRQYLRKAGIQVARPGTHTFRYSCAQRLLTEGAPLKVISDYLGHILPMTTQQYLKIAVEDLREVACGDGEEVIL